MALGVLLERRVGELHDSLEPALRDFNPFGLAPSTDQGPLKGDPSLTHDQSDHFPHDNFSGSDHGSNGPSFSQGETGARLNWGWLIDHVPYSLSEFPGLILFPTFTIIWYIMWFD